MRFGVHIATAGNLMTTPTRAREMGADLIQIFIGNPRGWRATSYSPDQGKVFRNACAEAKMGDVFIHEIYLVSYGNPDEEARHKSIAALSHSLEVADLLDIRGVVTHLGSHKGQGLDQALQRMKESFTEALKDSKNSWLILENSAGSGGNIGGTLEELAQIFDVMDRHPRMRVCLDTAHTLASGYEIRTPEGLSQFLDKFDKLIGLDRLACMHLNDSKVDIGTHVDRHENIGDGYIGNNGFRVIVNEPRLVNVPGILEVPGVTGDGPDAANLERLRKLVK